MNIRSRLVAPCFTVDQNNIIKLDLNALIENLLLFDKFILYSTRLLEIPYLIKIFGYDEVMKLFSSGALAIHCDAVGLGEIGQNQPNELFRHGKPKLPLGSFSFTSINQQNHKDYIHSAFLNFNSIPISKKQIIKLKGKVSSLIKKYPTNTGTEMLLSFKQEIKYNNQQLKISLANQIRKDLKVDADIHKIKLNVEEIDDLDFRVISNLGSFFSISDEKVHNITTGALLSYTNLIRRIQDMKIYEALSGFNIDDIPIFESKISFLEKHLDPETQVGRLHRINSSLGFPDFNEAILSDKFSLSKLLEIRETDECREFRDWLWTIDALSEEELKEKLESLKSKFSNILSSKMGKAIRWLTTTGIGSSPISIAAIPLSLLDSFLIEKFFPKNGAMFFINNLYPSIFKSKT